MYNTSYQKCNVIPAMSLLFQHGNERNVVFDITEEVYIEPLKITNDILRKRKSMEVSVLFRDSFYVLFPSFSSYQKCNVIPAMSLLFQYGNGKNAYDPYTNGKK